MYLIIPVFAVFLIYVVLLVRKSQLSMKYTYLWVLFSVMSLTPIFLNEEIDRTLNRMGFEVAANGIIVISIAFLSFVSLHLSIQLSSLENKLENLATGMAVDRASKPSNDS